MMSTQRIALTVAALLAVCYLGFCAPLIPVASQDFRMANVFSVDESDIVAHVWNLYVTGGHIAPSFKYGGVFYYVPVGLLYVWSVFGAVTEQAVLLVVRGFCTVAGAGCLLVTFCIGREVFNARAGLIAALLLCATPTFLRWAVESHPDLPQLFFLLGSLFFACRCAQDYRPSRVLFAAGFAGLAFGTKYAGGFFLPVVMLTAFLPAPGEGIFHWMSNGRRWGAAALAPVVFALVFAVTNPLALTHFSAFADALRAEKAIMGFGHRLQVASAPWQWLWMLFGLMGTFHCAVVLAAGSRWAMHAPRRPRADRIVVLLWVAALLAYLMLESNLKRPRHLLPVLPAALLFVGASYDELWRAVSVRFARWPSAVLWLVVAVLSQAQISSDVALFKEKFSRADQSAEITVGRWLADAYPPETSILFDAYAYVPASFRNVFRTFGMNYPLVNHFEPDVLVVRDAIAADYENLDEAPEARIGAVWFKANHYFYAYLQGGLIPTYRLRKDFGSVAVYERTAPRVRNEGTPRARWLSLVEHFRRKEPYGRVAAWWTMGYVHLSQGLHDEAEQDFARARGEKNFARRVYAHGCRMLALGRVDAAEYAFKAALAASNDQSLPFRTGMREDMAYRYLNAGLYGETLTAAEGALALHADQPVAAFECAVARLALGAQDEAVTDFRRAVNRFGAHPKGAELLKVLIEKDVAVAQSRHLLAKYYGGAN